MRTTDLFNFNRSSKRLNESLHKTFGTRINFETFDTPKLEDARNKLRTQIHTARTASGFNETVENETLTKAQFMHDAIVAELMDRQEHIVDTTQTEGFGSLEDAVLEVLKRFDENMNEIGGYGDPDAEKIIAMLKQGDVESAIDIVYDAYSDQDGGELRNMDPYIEDLQADFEDIAQGGDTDDEGGDTDDGYALASAGFGSDEDYESVEQEGVVGDLFNKAKGMFKKKPAGDDGSYADGSSIKTPGGEDWEKQYQQAVMAVKNAKTQQEYDDASERAGSIKDLLASKGIKVGPVLGQNESIEQTGDDMRNLREGEIQQASAIVTAKTMVDRVGRWIEELSGMENETLLQLGDSIRDEMGQEQAKAFIEAVAPAIQQALDNLKQTRDTLSTGVRSLASGEQPADMLGAEPEMDGDIGMDMAGPDTMNEPEIDAEEDPFAAAEPGAGGMETTGREQRESIDRQSRLMKILAG
jgi:hypothetical protein